MPNLVLLLTTAGIVNAGLATTRDMAIKSIMNLKISTIRYDIVRIIDGIS